MIVISESSVTTMTFESKLANSAFFVLYKASVTCGVYTVFYTPLAVSRWRSRAGDYPFNLLQPHSPLCYTDHSPLFCALALLWLICSGKTPAGPTL